MAIQEHERRQIGRELHDSIGQMILAVRLGFARLRIADQSENEKILSEIGDMLQEVEQQVRSISFLNYPAELASDGLEQSLRALVLGFGRRSGLKASFDCDCDDRRISRDAALALLRVAQEALVNIQRHAQANKVAVRLERHGDRIELTIDDDGLGIPSSNLLAVKKGLGLAGMRHRIECLGGTFSVSGQRQGTQIVAALPPTGWRTTNRHHDSQAAANDRRERNS